MNCGPATSAGPTHHSVLAGIIRKIAVRLHRSGSGKSKQLELSVRGSLPFASEL
jgi:hypothetical protein